MATEAAGDDLLRNLLEGCIAEAECIDCRPYHRNYGCALHNSTDHCRHRSKHNKVSYPIHYSWCKGSLVVIGHSSQSPSSSPIAGEMPRTPSQLALFKVDDWEMKGHPTTSAKGIMQTKQS